MKKAIPQIRTCAAWGPLDKGELQHSECPVIIRDQSEVALIPVDGKMVPATTGPVPRVCPCECRTCNHAWWDDGRPRIADGKVVRK